MAIKMSGIKNIIVLLNKLDLVKKSIAIERFEKLKELLNKYDIEPKIIIPVCMNHMIGVDLVLQNIMIHMSPNIKRENIKPLFMISRSFDINKVNINMMDITGGVIGGSLISGSLKVGDEIEIAPGKIGKNADGTINHKPHYTTILSLKSDITELDSIVSGGLIGIGTDIDPFYCKNDNMIGMIAGLKGTLPQVYYDINIKYNTIKFDEDKFWVTYNNQNLTVIVGTNSIDGVIKSFDDKIIKLQLSKPACIDNDDIIILCDKKFNSSEGESFNIVAYGYLSVDEPTNDENHSDIEDPFENTNINIDDIDIDNR